jgi:hypothetical protein
LGRRQHRIARDVALNARSQGTGEQIKVGSQVIAVDAREQVLHAAHAGHRLILGLRLGELILGGLNRLLHLGELLDQLRDGADIHHRPLRLRALTESHQAEHRNESNHRGYAFHGFSLRFPCPTII